MNTRQILAAQRVLSDQRDKLLIEMNQDLKSGDQDSAMWRALMVRAIEITDKVLCAVNQNKGH